MNLKFDDIQLTEDGLMYIKFKLDEKEFEWFPKWDDLAWLVACAFQIEENEHSGKWRTWFEIMAYEILISSLIAKFKLLDSESEEKLLNVFTKLRHKFLREHKHE